MKSRTSVRLAELAGLQYVGSSGSSKDCVDAVRRLVVLPTPPASARLVTAIHDHAFVLFFDACDAVVIKNGFTSGYRGTGPTALAEALSVLNAVGIDVEEVEVPTSVMERLAVSALTSADLELIESSAPVRPARWFEYVHAIYADGSPSDRIWGGFETIVPLAALDPRLVGLGRRLLNEPDAVLMDGFRMLEDRVRARTRSSEHGAKLFAQAFQSNDSKLMWRRHKGLGVTEPIDSSEQIGRANLFIGAYQAFRNPRAHRTLTVTAEQALCEFMVLNQLFLLEADAVDRPPAEDDQRA